MAKPQNADIRRSAPRLYLVTPPIGEVEGFADSLGQAIAAADVAALLVRLKSDAERTLIDRVKRLASIAQPQGVALLIDGQADLVARAGADGAHLPGIEAFTAVVASLKPERIAGCGGLRTRHDAMLAGERAADYVMFGDPGADARRPSFEAIVERIEWWAGLFEIPCVGFAATVEEIAPLTAAGADFVAIGGALWDDPRGAAASVADAAARLVSPAAVP